MPRKNSTTIMTFYGSEFLRLWYSGNDTGGSIGVAWGKRNVHMTVWFKDEVMNCHITDGSVRVWEKSITLKELESILRRMERKCIGRWKPHHRIMVLDPARLDAWNRNTVIKGKKEQVDLGRYISEIAPAFFASHGEFARIEDIMGKTQLFGLQRSRLGWNFVIADPSGAIIRWPVNPARSPLYKVPTVQGMLRFMRYIEKEGFFDYIAPSISKEAIERLAREVELAALQMSEGHDDRTE